MVAVSFIAAPNIWRDERVPLCAVRTRIGGGRHPFCNPYMVSFRFARFEGAFTQPTRSADGWQRLDAAFAGAMVQHGVQEALRLASAGTGWPPACWPQAGPDAPAKKGR